MVIYCSVVLAGGIFLVIHKPLSSGKAITETQWLFTVHLALGKVVVTLLGIYSMSLCGPFRNLLVNGFYDFIVVAGFASVTTGAGGPKAIRGVILFFSGLLVLLFLDHDEVILHPEKGHSSSWMGLADHKIGILLSFVTLLSNVGLNTLATKLGSDIGGQKRLNALVTAMEGVALVPLSFIITIRQESSNLISLFNLSTIFIIALCIFVVPYYIHSFCLQRLDLAKGAKFGTITLFIMALICANIWLMNSEHTVSGGSIFACSLFILATIGLTADFKPGTKGAFIGYTENGLPLYSFGNTALQQTSKSIFLLCGSIIKQILSSQNSRKIFYFLCLNMCFTIVELTYGIITNSLGLISDGFHMLFDCSALIMGLIASVMAKWKPSRTFSYGYTRIEDLSGFVNGLFLLVISFFVFTEAVNRLFDPPDINTNKLLVVSVSGLCVNLLGILAFSHSTESHGHSHGGGSHTHSHNANMEGVFLHVLADTLGSVGVIISSILIENFGWFIADPICSILIATLIFLSVIPLLKNSARVLLLGVPNKTKKELSHAIKKVLALDGVKSVTDPKLWIHSSTQNIGSIRIQTSPEGNEQRIALQVTAIFKSLGYNQFTAQVEKETFLTHLSGLGVDYCSNGIDFMRDECRVINSI